MRRDQLRRVVPPPRPRRLTQLYAGLVLYGFSDALMLLAGLGVDPWDVLHQGLSRRLGLGVGTWAIIVGAVVLSLWVPLRQRPGFGTLSNVVVVGAVIDLCMATIPAPDGLTLRTVFLLAGVGLNGVATGAYIGAGLGPGPRDGVMTGLAARGHSIRVVRTGLELSVLAGGWVLGGTVGVGTVVYAVAIGPLAHIFIPLLRIDEPVRLAPAGEVDASEAERAASDGEPGRAFGEREPRTQNCHDGDQAVQRGYADGARSRERE
jgi:uncharacterized membrane protein YczE